jgi:hypothetical protein
MGQNMKIIHAFHDYWPVFGGLEGAIKSVVERLAELNNEVHVITSVFLDIEHGPRFSECLPQFFITKKEILDKGVRYDEIFDTPTGFREESDFQLQIKHLGYKLLYDPTIYVIHLAADEGGNRPKISMGERMYWKARNHTIFILKWHTSILKRVWYVMFSILILSLYRIWLVPWIFRGVKDGVRNFCA